MGYTWEGKSGEVVHIVYERGDDIFVSTLVGSGSQPENTTPT